MTKIKKTDHFYLIDGSGYIFRAYYALPPLTRKSDGLPTGAVNGFCNMLFKLLLKARTSLLSLSGLKKCYNCIKNRLSTYLYIYFFRTVACFYS